MVWIPVAVLAAILLVLCFLHSTSVSQVVLDNSYNERMEFVQDGFKYNVGEATALHSEKCPHDYGVFYDTLYRSKQNKYFFVRSHISSLDMLSGKKEARADHVRPVSLQEASDWLYHQGINPSSHNLPQAEKY